VETKAYSKKDRPLVCGVPGSLNSEALLSPPVGYLGYTSSLSLTCMLFFLISVSLRARVGGENGQWWGTLKQSLLCELASLLVTP
jgi:hypothetical protein